MSADETVELGTLRAGSRFRSGQYIGNVLAAKSGETVSVRTFDTKDRKLLVIDGREHPAMKRSDQQWPAHTPVVPITIVEFQAIATRRPEETLGTLAVPPEPDPQEPEPHTPTPEPALTSTPDSETRAPEPPKSKSELRRRTIQGDPSLDLHRPPATATPVKVRPKLLRRKPPTEFVLTRPCMCGCGEPVRGMFKRGHIMRLEQWARRLRAGDLKMTDVPEIALAYMRASSML